jgi:hypothetical protein
VRLLFSILAALATLAFAPAAQADYYVVVGEASTVAQLSQQDVLHLFMGRSRSFPDGSPAAPHDLAGSTQREGFYRVLSGMSLAQVTSYWARLMFSGRSLPPAQLADESALVEKLRADASAIGWLPAPPAARGVRTVLVLRTTR